MDRSLCAGMLVQQMDGNHVFSFLPRISCTFLTSRSLLSESEMARMMPGSMAPCLNSLQQHRKSLYAGNGISGRNEKGFPQKSCDYREYNMLPSNKSEGELELLTFADFNQLISLRGQLKHSFSLLFNLKYL